MGTACTEILNSEGLKKEAFFFFPPQWLEYTIPWAVLLIKVLLCPCWASETNQHGKLGTESSHSEPGGSGWPGAGLSSSWNWPTSQARLGKDTPRSAASTCLGEDSTPNASLCLVKIQTLTCESKVKIISVPQHLWLTLCSVSGRGRNVWARHAYCLLPESNGEEWEYFKLLSSQVALWPWIYFQAIHASTYSLVKEDNKSN